MLRQLGRNMSELRWNPLLEEWLVTATHRQERTFLPPPDYCPLCPTVPGGFPTEVPSPTYDIVVFENKFPSFSRHPGPPSVMGNALHPAKPSVGICEVVLYSPHHTNTLTDESVEQIYKLVRVWTDRFAELGARPEIEYVFIFENKGEVIGVTIPHPHGQIYAFPYIPPHIARELESSEKHFQRTHTCLLCDVRADEERDGRRLVFQNRAFTAVVPYFARYPYEVHIYSNRHFQALTDMTSEEQQQMASMLKTILLKYDHLFGFSFPYMMVLHQRPTNGKAYDYYHFHVEFYPPLRTATKLKYLAGCESGAGTFINDTLPEEKAAELRAAEPNAAVPK